jgi:hypothetical protein
MSELSWSDRLRIEWAVRRVDFDLDARVPRARRRQIRNELRSNLTEAAQAVGATEAVRHLGDLHALAMSYLHVYRGRWDFRAGSIAALVTYAAIQVLALAIFIGFSSGVLAGGGHSASYQFWSSFGPFSGSASPDAFGIVVFSRAHLALMAVAFVFGSAYRLVLRRAR